MILFRWCCVVQRACYLAPSAQREESADQERALYSLPDGSAVEIGPARYRAPELLFRPDLCGEEYEGIHEVLSDGSQGAEVLL